ncbi:MAG: Phosphoenolpyruvate carboxykinase [ATP] [Candidatus Jettenia ecosi]|uniref:Phosphoenolpyruvate carboxykinase [ATP] n=1 Tax=Candidatus Jettenia ecosi TaxID=2494326 RepID=A0A533QDL7_9BACT|nr:MAG: Phosphoenolpyruvate carboxykinase [ATP] [Candidatus Jettenia ecosi]
MPIISSLTEEFEVVKRIVESFKESPNVINSTDWTLRRSAERFASFTKFGNVAIHSTVKNRSAKATVYVGNDAVRLKTLNAQQNEIMNNLPKTLALVENYIKRAPFVRINRTMGNNSEFSPSCTIYVSIQRPEMVRLAYMTWATLFSPRPDGKLKQYIVYIPEWQEAERQILVFPEISTTIVLGSDYYGESKKGFLRMAMWNAKQKGMLGLHAGSKILKARGSDGRLRRYGMLIFGMSGAGKTTHTCHTHDLHGKDEGIEILQDDVVFLKKDGSAYGSERGFYLKTEGLDPVTQPIIYKATTSRDAIFENVMIDYEGNLYFDDDTLTSNGRGIMMREDLRPYISDTVNLPPIDEVDGLIIAFITRRHTVVPLAVRLTPEQAAAVFMLGESIETSAGDPRRTGESIREVGTNPFIIGDKSYEGNWFYDFVKRHERKVHCYQLNTGGLGEIIEKQPDGGKIIKRKVQRVEIPEMSSIIRGIVRGTNIWGKDKYWNLEVPSFIEGVDLSKYDVEKFYSVDDVIKQVSDLRCERVEYIEKFNALDKAIIAAAKIM